MSIVEHSYRIAIPSYKRARTLVEKTLRVLFGAGVSPSIVDVFVADESERASYVEAIADERVTVIVASPGMAAVRNAITGHYTAGSMVVCVDDDVERLVARVDEKTVVDVGRFDDVAQRGFDLCRQVGARLWGVYPVANPYFMKERVRFDLTYIEGALWGMVVSHDGVLNVDLEDKEDYLRSVKCYVADGAVVRIENISFKSRFYTEPGGMQHDGERTKERIRASALEVARRYPTLVKVTQSASRGTTELRLSSK